MMDIKLEKYKNLLLKVPPLDANDTIRFQGVEDKAIRDFTKKYGIIVPDELRQWLKICNGAHINPGGVYGIANDDSSLDIIHSFELIPEWIEKGWIPLAGDGCGDYYVLDTRNEYNGLHPVYFIDQEDYEVPCYIVASNLWVFFEFLFECGIFDDGNVPYWPFNKDKVILKDPNIVNIKSAPLPWEAD